MGNHKKYWKSEIELSSDNEMVNKLRDNEFVNELPIDNFLENKETLEDTNTNRRDFLKYLGFSTAAATLASCEGPVNKSIPYVVQPEQIRPGISNFYATSISDGFDFANVLVKTREGRPIKIEKNSKSEDQGPNARIQASVLSLYDSSRIQGPTMDGQDISWELFNLNISAQLQAMQASDKRIVLLTQTFCSCLYVVFSWLSHLLFSLEICFLQLCSSGGWNRTNEVWLMKPDRIPILHRYIIF